MRTLTLFTSKFAGAFFPIFLLLILFSFTSNAQCVGDVTAPTLTGCSSSIANNNTPGLCGRVVNYAFPVATDNCQPVVNMPFNTQVQAATSYTENGYIVETTRRINVFNAVGVANGPILAPETLPATWTLRNVDDHLFTMTSLEMGAFNFTSNPQTDVFIGVKGDGSTVSYSFTSTAAYGAMELVTFPASFTNLVSMHWAATINIYDNFLMTTLPKITRTSGFASGAFFPVGTTTVTYVAEDLAGNMSAPCTFTVTIADTEPPTFTSPANKTIFTDANCNFNSTVSVTGSPTNVRDNCGGPLTPTFSDAIIGGSCPGTHIITRIWKLVDTHGNHAGDQQQIITVLDNTPPTFTRPADKIIPFTSTCDYDLSGTGDVTNESDNCSTGLNATATDVVTSCGNNIVIKRTWHLVDNCGNAAADQVQTITVTDNNTAYVIYTKSEAKFGEDNIINGDVGVTATNGKAEFKKGDDLGSNHVYAKNITVQMPANVVNKHFIPATDGPAPPFYNYAGGGLSGNYTLAVNGSVPVGNYKELTIKHGVIATVNGSNYGKVKIEEGADVTFTSVSIDMEELTVGKGKNNGTTNVHFTNCTALRVKDKVTIEEDCRVNVDGPKVNLYLGDTKKDEENFTVKGDNTQVTLNIMVPNGKLKINGGVNNCIMTGWFIVEKLESDGKNVTWNKFACVPPPPIAGRPGAEEEPQGIKETVVVENTANTTATVVAPKEDSKVAPEVVETNPSFKVNVYPNPSTIDFRIMVSSNSNERITVRLTDEYGRVLSITDVVLKGATIKIGTGLQAGTYYAEVSQGANRQLVKLVKLNK